MKLALCLCLMVMLGSEARASKEHSGEKNNSDKSSHESASSSEEHHHHDHGDNPPADHDTPGDHDTPPDHNSSPKNSSTPENDKICYSNTHVTRQCLSEPHQELIRRENANLPKCPENENLKCYDLQSMCNKTYEVCYTSSRDVKYMRYTFECKEGSVFMYIEKSICNNSTGNSTSNNRTDNHSNNNDTGNYTNNNDSLQCTTTKKKSEMFAVNGSPYFTVVYHGVDSDYIAYSYSHQMAIMYPDSTAETMAFTHCSKDGQSNQPVTDVVGDHGSVCEDKQTSYYCLFCHLLSTRNNVQSYYSISGEYFYSVSSKCS